MLLPNFALENQSYHYQSLLQSQHGKMATDTGLKTPVYSKCYEGLEGNFFTCLLYT